MEFAPRRFDLPLVGAAVRLLPDGRARLTLAGYADTPLDAHLGALGGDARADDSLGRHGGTAPADASLGDDAAPAPSARRAPDPAAAAANAIERLLDAHPPRDDARAPAALRRHLARTLALRALAKAAGDA